MTGCGNHAISATTVLDAPAIAGILATVYPGSDLDAFEIDRQLRAPCVQGRIIHYRPTASSFSAVGFALFRRADDWTECYLSAIVGSAAAASVRRRMLYDEFERMATVRRLHIVLPLHRRTECDMLEGMGAARSPQRQVYFAGERSAYVYVLDLRPASSVAARLAGLDYLAALKRMDGNAR